MKIKLTRRVIDYINGLAPEPRRQLREAIRGLAHNRGDVRPLQREYEGLHRLRLGQYRVIFEYTASPAGPQFECFFVETRDIVYEMLAVIVAEEGRL